MIGFLADDAQEGRDNSSPASLRVQDFLVARLQTFALGGAADGSFRQPFANGTNLLARIPGAGSHGSETVVVGAHYDHLGAPGGIVYNGATDNAGGTAAVLAVGRALAALPVPPARSVLLALWDAEEDGLLGSLAYVAHPSVALADTVAYVNLDIVGSSPVEGFRRETFAVGVDTSPVFPDLVHTVTSGDPLMVGALSNIFGQDRSDHASFVGRDVPSLFFSDTTGACYHTPGDDVETVHFGKVVWTAYTVLRLVVALANSDARPSFTAPEGLPTYSDAVALRDALQRGLCNAADSGLTASQVEQAEGWVRALDELVARGEAGFRAGDRLTVGGTALAAIDVLASLPCQRN